MIQPKPRAEPPPAPEMDPRLGDKTPRYVLWYFAHHDADEVAKKYGGRRISGTVLPLRPTAPPDFKTMDKPPTGDIPKDAIEVEAKEVWIRK